MLKPIESTLKFLLFSSLSLSVDFIKNFWFYTDVEQRINDSESVKIKHFDKLLYLSSKVTFRSLLQGPLVLQTTFLKEVETDLNPISQPGVTFVWPKCKSRGFQRFSILFLIPSYVHLILNSLLILWHNNIKIICQLKKKLAGLPYYFIIDSFGEF